MTRIRYAAPHTIDPSLIEIGDEIYVEHPKRKGVRTYVRGIVAHRSEHGKSRILSTAEGGTLLAWSPAGREGVKVLLYSRLEQTQEQLSLFPEIEERISA